MEMNYDEFVSYLLKKYGPAKYDYFTNATCKTKSKRISRTKEGLLTAQKMLKDSRFTLEDISNFSGLPLDEVKKLQMK